MSDIRYYQRLHPKTKCAAKSKRTGDPCGNYAVHDRTLCYKHGGALDTGGDGRPLEHGLYSKYVPDEWREDYEYFKSDPNHTSSGPELAVAQVAYARYLKNHQGSALSAEMIEVLIGHAERLTRIKERESKRLYQQELIAQVLSGWLDRAATALREILSARLPADQAQAVAQEFAAKVREIAEVKAAVGL